MTRDEIAHLREYLIADTPQPRETYARFVCREDMTALLDAAERLALIRTEARNVREALAAQHIYLPCFDRLDALLDWENEPPRTSSEGTDTDG